MRSPEKGAAAPFLFSCFVVHAVRSRLIQSAVRIVSPCPRRRDRDHRRTMAPKLASCGSRAGSTVPARRLDRAVGVARSPADGYTLLVHFGLTRSTPRSMPSAAYDPGCALRRVAPLAASRWCWWCAVSGGRAWPSSIARPTAPRPARELRLGRDRQRRALQLGEVPDRRRHRGGCDVPYKGGADAIHDDSSPGRHHLHLQR